MQLCPIFEIMVISLGSNAAEHHMRLRIFGSLFTFETIAWYFDAGKFTWSNL